MFGASRIGMMFRLLDSKELSYLSKGHDDCSFIWDYQYYKSEKFNQNG
jgi:hypothetical protein